MKRLVLFALLAIATTAGAAGYLEKDPAQNYVIQGFAPNGKKTQALTVNRSGSINNKADLAWAVYAPSDCAFRLQSTTTRAGVVCTIPGGSRFVNVVNSATPFSSFSGCTSGWLQRH